MSNRIPTPFYGALIGLLIGMLLPEVADAIAPNAKGGERVLLLFGLILTAAFLVLAVVFFKFPSKK